MLNYISAILFVLMLLAETPSLLGQDNTQWEILVGKSLQGDEAVRVALRDLQETGLRHGSLVSFWMRPYQPRENLPKCCLNPKDWVPACSQRASAASEILGLFQ